MGRVGPEEDADEQAEQQGAQHRIEGDAAGPGEQALGQQGGRHPQAHPQQAADQRQGDRFDQELAQDMAGAGAEGAADADLAGALAHRHQHYVHDADASHHQRDGGGSAQQAGEDLGDRIGGADQIGLVADDEIVLAGRRDLVAQAQQVADLKFRRRHLIRVARRHRDAVQGDAADGIHPHDATGHGGQGDEHLVIRVAKRIDPLVFHGADDGEGFALDADRLAQRLRGRQPQAVQHRLAQHRHPFGPL